MSLDSDVLVLLSDCKHRCLSAARLLILSAGPADEESFEEEELQVPGGDDEEAEGCRPPGDVLRVGEQQEVVGAPTHAADAVVAENVENVILHFESCILQQENKQIQIQVLQTLLLLLQIPLLLLQLLLQVYDYECNDCLDFL